MTKKKIGFLSYWGVGRGLAYGTLMYAKMLKDEYDIYILKQGTNKISEEFKVVDVNITEWSNYIVNGEFFRAWIKDNKLTAVVFNEYAQWAPEPEDLITIAKEEGCRTYGYLALERFEPLQADRYDRIIAPTVSYLRFMRRHRIRNFTYIPHSIDMAEFNKKRTKNKKFVFFHPGGYGGVNQRKNTFPVIEAFRLLDNPDAELVVTHQQKLNIDLEKLPKNMTLIDKDLSRKEIIDFYYSADATVIPTKWETVGLPILESLAAGVPVITTDVPPMNEFIKVGMNGYLCSPDLVWYKGIKIKAAEVSPIQIKTSMENIMNKDIYPMLERNARYVVDQLYNLEKNKHYFLDFLKKDLK